MKAILNSFGNVFVRKEPSPLPRTQIAFTDLTENPNPALCPPLDQPHVDETALTQAQRDWRATGVNVLPGFIPNDLIDRYVERRSKVRSTGGWKTPTPYLHVPELRDVALYPPLMDHMRHLVGEEMLFHLALTGWVSTERQWHQDDYLNPSHVNSWYAAVWIALDDIHEDSGPFEYVPGSNRWPLLRGEKVRSYMTAEELSDFDEWPTLSESIVVPAIEREILRTGAPIAKFIAKRGDVLIWHGRLMHRGSKPNVPNMPRKALICHYSGINHRVDMANRAADENGKQYALFDHPLGEE